MYAKYLKTNTGEDFEVFLPETAHDITMGQFIAVVPHLAQTIHDIDNNIEIRGPYETLAAIRRLPVEKLYESLSPEQVYQAIAWYGEAFCYHYQALKEYQYKPKSVTVMYNGRKRKISLRRMDIEPSGANLLAGEVILREIKRHVELYGEDKWADNFEPSMVSMSQVVECFLYYPVTRIPYVTDAIKESRLSYELSLPMVVYIAKTFFNRWPEFNVIKKPSSMGRFFNTVMNRLSKKRAAKAAQAFRTSPF